MSLWTYPNGTVGCQPKRLLIAGVTVSNPTEAQFAEAGYLPHVPPVEPEPTLEQVKADRIEAIAAECDARLDALWPTTDRLAALAGVPVTPPAGLAEDVAAHLAIRDSLLDAVAAATTAEEVEAVTWPE